MTKQNNDSQQLFLTKSNSFDKRQQTHKLCVSDLIMIDAHGSGADINWKPLQVFHKLIRLRRKTTHQPKRLNFLMWFVIKIGTVRCLSPRVQRLPVPSIGIPVSSQEPDDKNAQNYDTTIITPIITTAFWRSLFCCIALVVNSSLFWCICLAFHRLDKINSKGYIFETKWLFFGGVKCVAIVTQFLRRCCGYCCYKTPVAMTTERTWRKLSPTSSCTSRTLALLCRLLW